MINTFTENLPYRLSEQIIIEYNKRLSDINHFVSGKYDYYANLKEDIASIQMLLALSIFYKRVLTNFDSATKFSSRVVLKSEAKSIQLGTYELSSKEIFKLNKVVITFRKLLEEYSIPVEMFEYLETKEFLRKVKKYKDYLDHSNNDKNG